MQKIGFVIPWFGWDIPGGAEAELRGLVTHFHEAQMDLEILTTCVKQFKSDWGTNFYKPGAVVERGITIRRFPADKRDAYSFSVVNAKLMQGRTLREEEEQIFCKEMVNSTALYDYIESHKEEYSLFVYIPYMFGTTYYGIERCPEKAVVIPCFHDESYIYMKCFAERFPKAKGMCFLAHPEEELAKRVYDLSGVNCKTLGAGLDTDWEGNAEAFREKYNLHKPYILYAGRKEAGKKVDTLINYFREYKARNERELELVLIGGGTIEIPEDIKEHVHDLGFVPIQDKYDAYAGAEVFVNPSHNESFSIVIMESMLAGRPILVSSHCSVTKDFSIRTKGGLYYEDYFQFEGALNYLLEHPEVASEMGRQGREYVLSHFTWPVIVERYKTFFEELCNEDSTRNI